MQFVEKEETSTFQEAHEEQIDATSPTLRLRSHSKVEPPINPVRRERKLRDVTVEELQQHCNLPSVWIAIDEKVYDVSTWAKYHPGGVNAITNVAGRDVSDIMRANHRPSAWVNKIDNWLIGNLVGTERRSKESEAITSEFRQLGKWLEENGWFIPNPFYTLRIVAFLLFLWAVSWALFFDGISNGPTASPKWTFYLSAFMLGFFWQQSNFLGHDIGHSSVFYNKKYHPWIGNLVGNLFTGLGNSWWKHSHETHHVVTNVVTHDPDIQQLPVFACSKKFFDNGSGKGAGIFSTYFDKFMAFDRIAQICVRVQHIMYFPILSVARVNLMRLSLAYTMFHPKCKGIRKIGELSSLAVFFTWWSYMLYLCPTWTSRVIFWYIVHCTIGFIHIQILLSHVAMETFHEVHYTRNDTESYFEYQLRTTMDIDCPWYMDWFHGGVQFQVEHHLYPRVPRHRLRALQEKVRAILAKYPHVKYTHYPFIEANQVAMGHIKNVAMHAKNGKLINFEDTVIFEALNCLG